MTRLLAVASLVVILAAACSSSSDDAASDRDTGAAAEAPSSTTTPPSVEPDDDEGEAGDGGADGADATDGSLLQGSALAERLAQLEGQLAIGNGPAMGVARPDGEALQVISAEDETAAQPTWSRDGTALAWSSVTPGRQSVLVQPFDDEGQPDGEPQVSVAEGFPIFYLQWSNDDQGLVFLRNAPELGQVDFGFLTPGQPVESAGTDTPFFVSWAPGSDRVLAHVGQRTVELHDPEAPADQPVEVLAQGDDYSAPVWIDDERALVIADDALAILLVDEGTFSPLAEIDGPIRFVLSPDRRRVAYRPLNEQGDDLVTAGLPVAGTEPASTVDETGLVVLDLETGERQTLADDSVVAWEWSPDGSRLAWLSLPTNGRLVGHWSFWSVDGSELVTGRTADFGLSRKYAGVYLPFFAQYAQSVTGWAPDGSAFAFAGNLDGDRGVFVQLIDDRAEAAQVSGGDFVTWGPGPTPAGGRGVSAA